MKENWKLVVKLQSGFINCDDTAINGKWLLLMSDDDLGKSVIGRVLLTDVANISPFHKD
jgi:hypothetical protein